MTKIEQALDEGQDLHDIKDQLTIDDWLDYRSSIMKQKEDCNLTALTLLYEIELHEIDLTISLIINNKA